MGENQKKILQMLAEGKISVEEATRLLSLIGKEEGVESKLPKKELKSNAKYFFVQVNPKPGHEIEKNGKVNIRIPMSLIRAGMKLSALIPPQVADDVNKGLKEKGINFDIRNLKEEYMEQIFDALHDTEILVDNAEADIKIYTE